MPLAFVLAKQSDCGGCSSGWHERDADRIGGHERSWPLRRLRARETDRRRDWVEKTTTDLARRFDTIRVEDLKVRAHDPLGARHP